MLKFIGQLSISLFVSLVFTFVIINAISGCVDWNDSNCVTPKQILEVLVP